MLVSKFKWTGTARASDTLRLLRLERSAMAVASYLNRILTALSQRERRLSRGESLFHDGDRVESLFLVVTGELRVSRLLPHGVELTLQRPTAGAIVHESSLSAERYACDAEAARSSTVRAVPVHRVLAAFRGSCELVQSWARHLEGELHRARTQAEILALRTVAERLDAWCALNSGALPPRGRWHQLAQEIGVSAEALYRELARRRGDRSRGAIRFNGAASYAAAASQPTLGWSCERAAARR